MDNHTENENKSNRNYWIWVAGLVVVAIFVPERYAILVFLGAIFTMLFEISDRLRRHYYFHKTTAESIETLVNCQIAKQ